MEKRHFGELTFLAFVIAALVLAVLNCFGLISEWKIAVCSISAAVLSLSQAYDKASYYKQIAANIHKRLSSSPNEEDETPEKSAIDMCAIMYVLAIVVFVVGLSMEKKFSHHRDLNTISLLCFALIFGGYWVDSYFSRKLRVIAQHLDEFEKKNCNHEETTA